MLVVLWSFYSLGLLIDPSISSAYYIRKSVDFTKKCYDIWESNITIFLIQIMSCGSCVGRPIFKDYIASNVSDKQTFSHRNYFPVKFNNSVGFLIYIQSSLLIHRVKSKKNKVWRLMLEGSEKLRRINLKLYLKLQSFEGSY